MKNSKAIEVRGARTHNLKGVDCRIPHRKVTVVTGPSGAGKSSLAFDTVFAEGQRRFVESMSTYARQFLAQMERPPVDAVEGVLPPVALEAKNSVQNARSTVGTITEVHDVLRLLWTHLGEVPCPNGHGPLQSWTPPEVARSLADGEAGERFLLISEIARPKRRASEALDELIRQGYARRSVEGVVERMEPGAGWPAELDPMPLVLGRFKAGGESLARLTSAVEEGLDLGEGRVVAVGEDRRLAFHRALGCRECGVTVPRPVPALFSFNSPLGACAECDGFGRVIGIDPERVVPDPSKSLAERPIAAWNSPAYEELYDGLLSAAAARGVALDLPWSELPPEDIEWIWRGKSQGGRRGKRWRGFVSLERFFAWLERRIYRVHIRVLLARYRAYNPCPSCGGARLGALARTVTVEGVTLPELTGWTIDATHAWLQEREWSDRQREVAAHLIDQLGERVGVLKRVGLGYLTLDRQARTLSGGETQRIHLAAALGSGLTSTMYVLDEPTIGLHPRDSGRLLALLRDLAERGNTVLVVEHDTTLIRGADHVIDLGPSAGELGGRLMAEGPLERILENAESLTAQYLGERPPSVAQEHADRWRREQGEGERNRAVEDLPRLRVQGARANNLDNLDVEFPLGALVAVTGVSGSGKSTLVDNVIYGTYQRSRGKVDVEPGEVDRLEGIDNLADVTLVDQRPLGRSSRSNPVTYVKAYDELRKLFAATPGAKARGITPGHFSFNVDRGRCPVCKGTGETEVDMHFMAAVSVVCEGCEGRRFRPEVLEVRCQGLAIDQALGLTVNEAIELFAKSKRLVRRLELLADVGLGYLRLGQTTSTLSGGEAQRLKLASFLDRKAKEAAHLFLFDEPTTGLHLADIDLLYSTLRRLTERGDGVVVVEHSSELVARADWIVDLGPGGGSEGGKLLYSGPIGEFVARVDSPTAEELRAYLGKRRPAASSA